jgi:hypothetical protein
MDTKFKADKNTLQRISLGDILDHVKKQGIKAESAEKALDSMPDEWKRMVDNPNCFFGPTYYHTILSRAVLIETGQLDLT